MDQQIRDVKGIVEAWNAQKATGRQFNTSDMYRFIELMNDRTRHMISVYRQQDVGFYTTLAQMASNAADLIGGTELENPEDVPEARGLIASFEVNEADFYTGLVELCVNACTLVTPGAKIIADGVDRTQI